MGDVFIAPPSLRNDTEKVNTVVDKNKVWAKTMTPKFIALDERLGIWCAVKTLGSMDDTRNVSL